MSFRFLTNAFIDDLFFVFIEVLTWKRKRAIYFLSIVDEQLHVPVLLFRIAARMG